MRPSREPLFRIVEHEADIGFEVCGRDEAELLEHAGHALLSLITDPGAVEARSKRHIVLERGKEQLVVFLNELLYLWETDQFLPRYFSVRVKRKRIKVEMTGDTFDPARHPVYREIKAATYHKFAVRREADLFRATVYLDI